MKLNLKMKQESTYTAEGGIAAHIDGFSEAVINFIVELEKEYYTSIA